MAGLLKDAGFDVISAYGSAEGNHVDYPENIDVVIINSCTVKNLAESKFFKELRYWCDKGIKVVVAGCIPQAEKSLLEDDLKDISVIGTRQITHVADIVRNTLGGMTAHDMSDDYDERLELPKIRKNAVIEIIPVLEGCASNCSYCKTKFARGELKSYPKEKILAQFRSAVDDGCKEFWITSQDNGCYGLDIYRKEKYFLSQLLEDMLNIEGDFRIRLGMCNPDHIDRIKYDLVRVLQNPKMFRFLHIPVQSGNDKVLKDMRRSYTIKEFSDMIDFFHVAIPDITISTDIIVGFPGESEEEFRDTLELIKRCRFDVLNISRFWPRKGTDAFGLKQLPSEVMVDRTKKTKALFDELSMEHNSRFIGKNFHILIDEPGMDGSMHGRTDSYKEVIIKDSSVLKLGDFVDVNIVASTRYQLIGRKMDTKLQKV